jgi:hypothetical protein
MGQASSLVPLAGDLLLTIHAHRSEDAGIYVRVVDFRENRWNLLEEKVIWGRSTRPQTTGEQTMVEMFTSLRFGQLSLTRIADGEILGDTLERRRWPRQDSYSPAECKNLTPRRILHVATVRRSPLSRPP